MGSSHTSTSGGLVQTIVTWLIVFLVSFGVPRENVWGFASQPDSNEAAELPPNIVVIFVDDLGYADIRPFGETPYATPALERMAKEGRRFTDFIVTSAVCSASRASLLTGCHHERVGIAQALMPQAKIGLAASEVTLGELCQSAGYATTCIGKWHLGHHPPFLPCQHGFDEFYGLPYSNDMWPYHPDFANLPADAAERKRRFPDLPLYRNNEIINPEVRPEDQRELTRQYTEHAIDFIRKNQNQPFLVYLAHTMVHVPLFAGESFEGKSERGLYADVVQEVDWSTGQILETLRELGLAERTLVLFTSDNGPWLSYGDHAGSAVPFREGKGTSFEGGVRVPTIVWWPGTIPEDSVCDELVSTIDVLPTVAKLIGASLSDNKIDGHDVLHLLLESENTASQFSPHESFPYYYAAGELQAIRDRRFKLVFPHNYRSLGGRPGGTDGTPAQYQVVEAEFALYDLKNDPGETRDVKDEFPEVVARLETAAEAYREELGDKLQQRTGNGIRPPGRVD
jgi:arylsulfatase A